MKIETTYPVTIEYDPKADKPSRIFAALARAIDSCLEIDALLARTLSGEARVSQQLIRVEIGSLVTWIQSLIEIPDDSTLVPGTRKPQKVKTYIEKGRTSVIQKYSRSPDLQDPKVYQDIRHGLSSLALAEEVRADFTWNEPETMQIAETLKSMNDASKDLAAEDKLKIGSAPQLPPARPLDLHELQQALVQRTDSSVTEATLIIKKPDLLGESRWDFRMDGRVIAARINDETWVANLHHRKIRLTTGDSLRVRLRTDIGRDIYGKELTRHYEILQVLSVVDSSTSIQAELFSE